VSQDTTLFWIAQESALLHRWNFTAPHMTLVAAAFAATNLWLLLESCHCLWIEQTRTLQIVVVLVPILFQSAPHMPVGLMTPESSISHLITPIAGATRVGLIDMTCLLSIGAGGRTRTGIDAAF
jgi:hypothetical protein